MSLLTLGISGNTDRAGFAYDSDAEAFFTHYSITDNTIKNAINDVTLWFKNKGVWSKIFAAWPIVGGTAALHKANLKTPGTRELTFYGGWTHSATGMLANGTTGYADTGVNENTHLNLNDAHISIYIRTDADGLYCDMGTTPAFSYELNIFSKFSNVFYPRVQATNSGTTNSTNSKGLFIANRVGGGEVRAQQAGSLKVITNSSVQKANSNIFIGANNRTAMSDIVFYAPREYAFATAGFGLTDQNMADIETGIAAFQAALSRTA